MAPTKKLEFPPHPIVASLQAVGFGESAVLTTLDYPLQNEREPEVLESPVRYWVVIRDQRPQFADSLRIEKFRPYRWSGDVGEGPQTGYGWVDDDGNTVSNAVEGVNPFDDYQVVLCQRIDDMLEKER